LTVIPLFLMKTSVLAVPRSIPKSLEKNIFSPPDLFRAIPITQGRGMAFRLKACLRARHGSAAPSRWGWHARLPLIHHTLFALPYQYSIFCMPIWLANLKQAQLMPETSMALAR
jgi:hypothetical protein